MSRSDGETNPLVRIVVVPKWAEPKEVGDVVQRVAARNSRYVPELFSSIRTSSFGFGSPQSGWRQNTKKESVAYNLQSIWESLKKGMACAS